MRGIDSTVEESVRAWEKRGYWKKAYDFQQKWWLSSLMATSLEKLVFNDEWEKMPEMVVKLCPKFADIQINKMTRDPDQWQGTYDKLMEEKSK